MWIVLYPENTHNMSSAVIVGIHDGCHASFHKLLLTDGSSKPHFKRTHPNAPAG